MKRVLVYGLLPVAFGLALTGCTRQEAGAGLGAAAGGALGYAVTGGPVGTVVGAAGGAVAGSAIARSSGHHDD